LFFTCTNTSQAATCTCNTSPRISPHNVVNHSSHKEATIHRSSNHTWSSELEDTLEKNEAYCHQWGAYLATAYRCALESFGAEAQDFKIIDNISSFVEWLHSELKLLLDTMSKVGDYGAATCSEMLLHLLEQQGCDHFRAFGSQGFEFPSPDDVPAPSKIVELINKIILRNFWAKSGRAHSRKKAVDRLAKVRPFGLL
jgi:hypothetical protein